MKLQKYINRINLKISSKEPLGQSQTNLSCANVFIDWKCFLVSDMALLRPMGLLFYLLLLIDIEDSREGVRGDLEVVLNAYKTFYYTSEEFLAHLS